MPTIKQYAQAIHDAQGIISVAARRLGVNRRSIYKARDRSEKVREAIEDAREATLDFAEGKLMQQINEGNTTAIIFFLKCLGKKRGYIERTEHDVNTAGNLEVVVRYED